MAGAVTDFFGTATVTPGDGRPRELGRILDRNDDLYMNNGYLRLSNNTRVDLRTIIENPPGSGTPNVVTSANALPDNYLVMGDGVRTIQTTTLASTGSTLTVPNAFSAGDGNDAVTLNGVNWPIAAPSAGNILTATNGTTTAWSAPTSVAVTTVASGGGSGDSLVIAGGPGAVTLKDIAGGTGITVTNDADDIIISLTGGAGVTGTGTNNYLTLWNGTTAIDASAVRENTAGNWDGLVSINSSVVPTGVSGTTLVAGNSFASFAAGTTGNGKIIAGNAYGTASSLGGGENGLALIGNTGGISTTGSNVACAAMACTGTNALGLMTGAAMIGCSYCAFQSGNDQEVIILASQAVQAATPGDNTVVIGYANSTTPATTNRQIEMYANGGTMSMEGTITQPAGFTDIAEYYENLTNVEYTPGTVLTLAFDGTRKCKPAGPNDQILGVVSATASIKMNAAPFSWGSRYLRDKYGKFVYEDQPKVNWKPDVKKGQTEADRPLIKERKQNPNYDPTRPYTPRTERPNQWSCVATYRGAQIYVQVDDSSKVKPGDYLKVKANGICEVSVNPTPFRVMEITDTDMCWCLFV